MSASSHRGRVLLIGGDELDELHERLCAADYDSVRVRDGEPVEEAFRRVRPDAGLVSVRGDIAAAWRSLGRLRQEGECRHVPVLLVGSGEPPVEPEQIPLVEAISPAESGEQLLGRLRTGIEVKQLIEQTERRSERLESLLEIGRALNSTLDSRAILYIITRKLSEAMELGRCSFIVPDLASGVGRVIACKDDPNIQSLEINLGNYPEIIQVLRTGERVIIEDVSKDPIMAGVRKFADVFRDQSIMTLPLRFHDETIGVLQIRKKSAERGFSDREIEYCELLANSAANALKNAQLYEAIESHNERLRRQKRELEDLSEGIRRKNAKLLELQQVKSDFTAMIVHDLRSPMMIVQGVLDLLAAKSRNPRERELIGDGLGTTKKILALIRNILEVSKIEAGELHLELESLGVASLLHETVEPFQVLAHSRDVELCVQIDPGLETIHGDRGCLYQIIDNLVSNAFKFVPDGGRISVQVAAGANGTIRLTVADSGPGIANDEMSGIFKRFKQGRGQKKSGVGLGLSIVDLLTRAHGGQVAVDSELGKGSRFTVILPADPEAAGAGG